MLSGEAEALAEDARGLSVDDHDVDDDASASSGPDEQAIPDLEDAADDAEEEEKEDVRAANASLPTGDDGEEETGSVAASEPDLEQRANPLQSNENDSRGAETADEEEQQPDIGVEVESEDDGDHEGHDQADGDSFASPSTPATSRSQSTQPQPKQQQLARGKRSKAKRAQKKYAEQDEEDRALAMQLLGSSRGQERKKAVEEDKTAREAKAQADRERRKAQHAKAAERERLRHERLEKAAAEGTADLEEGDEQSKEQLEQERRELLDIDRLVPYPQPGDELLAAIPVVAPWTAMARQKYKIKLQPGNVKKGKAVKEILGFWTTLDKKGPKVVDESSKDKERVWRRELDLLKEWRAEEVVGYVPVKGCRIVQGGGIGGGVGSGSAGGKGKGSAGAKGKSGGGGKKGR